MKSHMCRSRAARALVRGARSACCVPTRACGAGQHVHKGDGTYGSAPAARAAKPGHRRVHRAPLRHRSERSAHRRMNEELRVQSEQIDALTTKNEVILDELRRLKSTLQLHLGGYATP